MKPAPFDLVRAETLEEALEALHQHGDEARILAGGQSLLPMLNMRLATPAVLVDVMRVPGLSAVQETGAGLVIPAGARQADVLGWAGLVEAQPLLAKALPWVGHFQTRARGTLVGSAAHADPSAEVPLCLVALGGEVRLRAKRARRTVLAAEFFLGMMTTAKRDDELIEAITFPNAKPGTGYAFREVARRHGDFAIVACAAVVEGSAIHLAVGGVADSPQRRSFPVLEGNALDDALNAFAWDLNAREDIHASARHRRDLVRQVGRAVIEEARQCRA